MIAEMPAPSPSRLQKHTDLRAQDCGLLSLLPRLFDFRYPSSWRLYGINPAMRRSDSDYAVGWTKAGSSVPLHMQEISHFSSVHAGFHAQPFPCYVDTSGGPAWTGALIL